MFRMTFILKKIHHWIDEKGEDLLVGFENDFENRDQFLELVKIYWLENNPESTEAEFDELFSSPRVRSVARAKREYEGLYDFVWGDIRLFHEVHHIEEVKICYQICAKEEKKEECND